MLRPLDGITGEADADMDEEYDGDITMFCKDCLKLFQSIMREVLYFESSLHVKTVNSFSIVDVRRQLQECITTHFH